MKTPFIALFAAWLFAAPPVFSQEETEFVDNSVVLTALPDNHQTRVFGDKINVRARPEKDAAVLDQLLIGDPVTVLATDEAELTLNGWTAPWSKIAYTKAGQRKEGYVWNGVLSLVSTEKKGTFFVYNIVKTTTKKTKTADGEEYEATFFQVEIRAARGGKIVSSVSASLELNTDYSTEITVRDSLAVPPYQTALNFTFFFAPCGYHESDIWCLWDGEKLTLLPGLDSSGGGDGGDFYEEETESYIFPTDENGRDGEILYESVSRTSREGGYDVVRRVRVVNMESDPIKKPVIED